MIESEDRHPELHIFQCELAFLGCLFQLVTLSWSHKLQTFETDHITTRFQVFNNKIEVFPRCWVIKIISTVSMEMMAKTWLWMKHFRVFFLVN